MLICHVTLRPRGRTIAADLAETAAAIDATTTGNVVFAALIDAPASCSDHVDAYVGELMAEAASAADTVTAGVIYAAAILEEVTAVAAQDGAVPAVIPAAMIEAASAGSAVDATISGAAVARDAMVGRVFVNSTGGRDAYVNSTMLNE